MFLSETARSANFLNTATIGWDFATIIGSNFNLVAVVGLALNSLEINIEKMYKGCLPGHCARIFDTRQYTRNVQQAEQTKQQFEWFLEARRKYILTNCSYWRRKRGKMCLKIFQQKATLNTCTSGMYMTCVLTVQWSWNLLTMKETTSCGWWGYCLARTNIMIWYTFWLRTLDGLLLLQPVTSFHLLNPL